MKCPNCGLINPESAQHCDCGYDFELKIVNKSYIIKRETKSIFWERIIALIIDGIILGIVGFIIGHLFYDVFVKLGNWARLVGFMITLPYFGIQNSKIFKGQTIGKRLFSINVINYNGDYISIITSFIRSAILISPFFLNNLFWDQKYLESIGVILITLIIFGLGGGLIFFYLFNSKSRQSIHDLICKTYVLKGTTINEDLKYFPKVQIYIYSFLIIVLLIFQFKSFPKLLTDEEYQEITKIQNLLIELNNMKYINTYIGTLTFNNQKETYTDITVLTNLKDIDYDKEAEKLGLLLLAKVPSIKNRDVLNISIIHGFDIGIASSWERHLKSIPLNTKTRENYFK